VYLYTKMLDMITSLLKERDGQAMVEYALILALIAIVVIVALHFLGGAVNNQLNNIAGNINAT
jgi:pilus assembly protein Flp/PilA